jgi:hypothetical protein
LDHRPDDAPGEAGHADDSNEPRWLKLASALQADADPATLARVRTRLAARPSEPGWVRWLARPAALAVSTGLLVVSAVAGTAFLTTANTNSDATDDPSMVSAILGDDGSYGLPDAYSAAGVSAGDSGEVQR